MTTERPQSKPITADALSAEQHGALRACAEAEMKKLAKTVDFDLSGVDFAPYIEMLIDRALNYPELDLAAVLPQLPRKIDSRLKHAVRHEAQIVMFRAIAEVRNKTSPSATSSQPKSEYFRLNLTIPEDLDAKLSEVGYRARATGGTKLRKTEILRALVRFLLELDVDVSGVRDEEEFLNRLRKAVGRDKAKK